jgi:DNA-binding Xre family transcriptional regulator
MKIKLNIKKIAKDRGIKTAYRLQRQANLSPSNASRLYNDNIKQISLDTLGKLCEALKCEPSDILVVEKSKKSKQ